MVVWLNHTDGSPPSPQDAISAGQVAARNPDFIGSVIMNDLNDTYYVLYVEDAKKAAPFTGRYGSQIDGQTNGWKSGSPMANHLKDDHYYGLNSPNETKAYNLADVLTLFDSGMRLIKVDFKGNSEAYSVKQKPDFTYRTPTKCKK